MSFYLVAIIANCHIDEQYLTCFLFIRYVTVQGFFGKNS